MDDHEEQSESIYEIEVQTEEDAGDEIPREQRHLRTQPYDKSISDLVSMIENEDIILNPEYQRNYIWDTKRASLLIESILLNVPIPVVYVSEEDDGKWSVVDGLQRLNTLHRYFGDKFKLKDLEILHELNGEKYSDLNPKAARLLRSGVIRVILIQKESHHEIKYDIFMRLNRGAVRLTEQELRNCLYRGSLNKLILTLREDKTFLEMINLSSPHRRMADAEMILRFFMLHDGYINSEIKLSNYSGNMRASLNRYMNKHKSADAAWIDKMARLFLTASNRVHAVFGNTSFKRFTEEENYDERANRAVMDSQLVAMSTVTDKFATENREEIVAAFESLCGDKEYQESLLIRTSNKSKTLHRIDAFVKALSQIKK